MAVPVHVPMRAPGRGRQQGRVRLGVLLRWVAAALMGLLAAGVWWWPQAPLHLRLAPDQTVVDLRVPPGTVGQRVAADAVAAGVDEPLWLLQLALRLSGQGPLIKAGSYELEPGITPRQLLDKLVRGEQATRSVTLVEGWTFAQFRQALQKAEHLAQDSQALSPAELMKTVGKAGVAPEGRFFPDTYVYPKHSSDLDVWRQAATAMDKALADAWAQRAPALPLRSPDEALILASLVEKETGQAADRPLVAGVFINRLRIGMRLQTDPSVAYGVLQAPPGLFAQPFDGRLRRVHLDTDTPYNTYTRAGLPPTPIAMPGAASLKAALHPASTKALYFVARGDGSSQFSDSLNQHNAAVRQHILKKP